ncbi:MAG: SAM-dependent methyltransferase, partial [Prevotella sp.]|nr:SAM-dependent methyltransferase [Prevotella sp.]
MIIKHKAGMSVKPIVELTADGSHTLFVPELNEHYHSVNGAIQESTHIFINAGLLHCEKDAVDILEIGFGTGLNAFLTLLAVKGTRKMVHYTGIELYPLSEPIIHALNYPCRYAEPDRELYYKLHDSNWEQENEISPNF